MLASVDKSLPQMLQGCDMRIGEWLKSLPKQNKPNGLGDSDNEFIHWLNKHVWVPTTYQALYKANFSGWKIIILGAENVIIEGK